jgi:ISXO2 transposase-like protein
VTIFASTHLPVRLWFRAIYNLRDYLRGKAGSAEAAPGHQLLCNLDRGARQAQPRSNCSVVSDGLQCSTSVADAGCAHQVVKARSGPKAARTPAFKRANTALGNIKAAITGTYRAINSKHVLRYLAEFEYRFNRRYDQATMIPRLTWAAVRTTPMPNRLLKLAGVYA